MKSIALYLIVMTTGLAACNNEGPETTLPVQPVMVLQPIFDHLTGTWKMENSQSFERWTKNSDSAYRSVVFSVTGTDTAWKEEAAIYPEAGKWVFENKVAGQNQGKAVRFISSLLNETDVEFSNPAHDFPTLIHYHVARDTIHAFIAGPNDQGGQDTIPFTYSRVKG